MYVKYLVYVLRHKWFVLLECLRIAADLLKQALVIAWMGVIHDTSKLSAEEFGPYARRFIAKADDRAEWDAAWKHHWQHNLHHWVTWAQEERPSPMPLRYRQEMLADWRAMSRAFGNQAKDWYLGRRETIKLHEETRLWVEEQLQIDKDDKTCTLLTEDELGELIGRVLGFVLATLGEMNDGETTLRRAIHELEKALIEQYHLDRATLLSVTAAEVLRRIQ
jgi:hypothetical protein